jgi:hypothetical protein
MANFRNVERIISAKDYGGSARGYIRKQQQALHHGRGIAVTIRDLDKDPGGAPVYARIWQGQWIADCECKGASFVDPEEPVFFCFSCGNRAHGELPRPVIFPEKAERMEIERLLLERPVDDLAGLTDMERAGMAKPLLFVQDGERALPLTRSWEPGQSIDDLMREQEIQVREWKNSLKAG